jgi:hypothetical protein
MPRENHHLFPNTFHTAPLDTWAAAIQRLPSGAKQCFLEQVVHYKALSDMEHEFLVVYASHPSGSKIVLSVDRNAQDSARALSTLVNAKSLPLSLSPSLSEKESSDLAYDRVQVSHDGTPAPILAQYESHVQLYTVTLSPTPIPSSSNLDVRCPPSLLHLSVLLLTIRTRFPSYVLLEYQCNFFARVTCLALMDLFGAVVTELEEGKRAATWRGKHISVYSAGRTALQNTLKVVLTPALEKTLSLAASTAQQNMLSQFASALQKMVAPPLLAPVASPWFIVPAGLYATYYYTVNTYEGDVVESEQDRRRIR